MLDQTSDTYLTHFKISFSNLRPTGLLVRAFNILPRKKSSTDCKTYNGTESVRIVALIWEMAKAGSLQSLLPRPVFSQDTNSLAAWSCR